LVERRLDPTTLANGDDVIHRSGWSDGDESRAWQATFDHGFAGLPRITALLSQARDHTVKGLFTAERRSFGGDGGSATHREELIELHAVDLADLFILEKRTEGAEP